MFRSDAAVQQTGYLVCPTSFYHAVHTPVYALVQIVSRHSKAQDEGVVRLRPATAYPGEGHACLVVHLQGTYDAPLVAWVYGGCRFKVHLCKTCVQCLRPLSFSYGRMGSFRKYLKYRVRLVRGGQ